MWCRSALLSLSPFSRTLVAPALSSLEWVQANWYAPLSPGAGAIRLRADFDTAAPNGSPGDSILTRNGAHTDISDQPVGVLSAAIVHFDVEPTIARGGA
jgi:hypothetical protein